MVSCEPSALWSHGAHAAFISRCNTGDLAPSPHFPLSLVPRFPGREVSERCCHRSCLSNDSCHLNASGFSIVIRRGAAIYMNNRYRYSTDSFCLIFHVLDLCSLSEHRSWCYEKPYNLNTCKTIKHCEKSVISSNWNIFTVFSNYLIIFSKTKKSRIWNHILNLKPSSVYTTMTFAWH